MDTVAYPGARGENAPWSGVDDRACEVDPRHALGVAEGRLLEFAVDRRARRRDDRDLEAEFARVDPGLHDAALGRAADEEEALDLQLSEQKHERSVVEGRVARLEDERLAVGRAKGGGDVAAGAGRRVAQE